MWPVLFSIPGPGIGLCSIALLVALIVRARLPLTWSGSRVLLVAIACGVVAGIAAASAGVVEWSGSWRVTGYAIGLLFGLSAALVLAHGAFVRSTALHIGNPPQPPRARDALIVALIGGMIGARARFVWENSERFFVDGHFLWRQAFDLDQGGMVWYGGLIGGALTVALWAWHQRIPHLPLADAVAPAIAAGIAGGRIGCFLNGCCYGRACDLPWAVDFPGHAHARHPAQLYETLATAALATLLFFIHRRTATSGAPKPGTTAAVFLIGYGCWRFFNEALRDDYRHAGTLTDLGGWVLTNSQITSVWCLVGGCVLLTWSKYQRPPTVSAPPQ